MRNQKLQKDPPTIYDDLPIDEFHDLRDKTKEELQGLWDKLCSSDVEADINPASDPEGDTHDSWRERYKIAIEEEIKARG